MSAYGTPPGKCISRRYTWMVVCAGVWKRKWRSDDMSLFFFFFQAEDGIRDYKVTGVQTCALPIEERGIGSADRHAASISDEGSGNWLQFPGKQACHEHGRGEGARQRLRTVFPY